MGVPSRIRYRSHKERPALRHLVPQDSSRAERLIEENITMKNFTRLAIGLLRDESGQGLIEYALIAGLIGLVAVVAMTSVGTQIKTAFNSISSQLASAV
jgi:pilus assembly protein Flp/PilA